jgi:hypothetical protein
MRAVRRQRAADEVKEIAVNTATKRLVLGGVVAGGLMLGAAGLVIGAGIAHAEPGSNVVAFQNDMTANGFHNDGGLQAQLRLGRYVCAEIASGYRPLTVAVDLSDTSTMTPYESGTFVAISVKDLCPQFMPELLEDAHRGHGSDAAYTVVGR